MPYVYGNRSGLSIIDLDQTLPLLRRAANLVREVVAADGVIMVVGTREGHAKFMRKAHERMGDNVYVVGEWLPGTLTNSATLYVLSSFLAKTLRYESVVHEIRNAKGQPRAPFPMGKDLRLT